MDNIRNFVIIAHIDHGKSTLADRLLEVTNTVEKRNMQAQYLDSMDLERERGITIKMAPVRMEYTLNDTRYTLNLIDTPGHSDFAYEVSRALEAVEGAILLVDATQGIQAQTLSNFETARKAGLKILGVVNKVDIAPSELIDSAITDLSELLHCDPSEIIRASGKTGAGVKEILAAVVEKVPPPRTFADITRINADKNSARSAPSPFSKGSTAARGGILNPPSPLAPPPLRKEEVARGLVFDSQYDDHKGVIAFIRVFSGSFRLNQNYHMVATGAEVKTKDIGYLKPDFKTFPTIANGEIGYIATGIKDPDLLKIGDTMTDINPRQSTLSPQESASLALPGYREPKPVVFVSFYPENAEDYDDFKKALGKLRLSDSALQFEPDQSEVLGRGFKGGFLGRLHFEIAAERIEREFDIPTLSSFPSVAYKVKPAPRSAGNQLKESALANNAENWGGEYLIVKNPKDFPEEYIEVLEPITKIEILTPLQYMGPILQLKDLYRLSDIQTQPFGIQGAGSHKDKMLITAKLPLADLISDFDDKLKSVSQGYGSLSYEVVGYEPGKLDKVEILVAENVVPGLTRILPKEDIEAEGRKMCERLKDLLPKAQFSQAIQARHKGRIIARETIAAMKKELGNFGKNGGDRTRKMKLWKKQARGKERLKERGVTSGVRVPASVFKELLKK